MLKKQQSSCFNNLKGLHPVKKMKESISFHRLFLLKLMLSEFERITNFAQNL